MTKVTRVNIYRKARNIAKKSRFEAAGELYMSDRTLARYELDETVPSPESVARMAQAYNAPWLTKKYCCNVCEIGRRKGPDGNEAA